METSLVKDIQLILKNYRSHDGTGSFTMTDKRISDWVMQFDESDQDFILSELKYTFNKCYYNKTRTRNLFKILIAKLGEKLEYNNTVTFLKESVFLDCQADGKSQKSILLIIKEMLLTDFNFKMDEAGSTTKKNYIYVDDILCTGKTLYDNVSKWGSEQDGEEKFIDKLKSKKITLNVLYLAASQSAYDKKMEQLYYHFDKRFNQDMVNPLVGRWIDKNRLKPVPNQPIQVFNYEEEVTRVVEAYVASKYAIENDFYRSEKLSFVEEFFSSEANRTRLENIFLLKGVEILNRVTIA